MGYKSLINDQVNKVFNAVKDLADDAVLSYKESSFDFNKDSTKTIQSSSLSTRVILRNKVKQVDKHSVTITTALLKTAEVGDIKSFSNLLVNNVSWKIGPVIESNGFVTTVQLLKET